MSPDISLCGQACLSFWYFAFGYQLGSLELHVQTQLSSAEMKWSVNAQYLHMPWTNVKINVESYDLIKVNI